MLHIHFGAGRLGLGLVAGYFQTPESELFLLNRAISGAKATGGTALDPSRRNELLAAHPATEYLIEAPGDRPQPNTASTVHYDGFFTYEDNVAERISEILDRSEQKAKGIVVTASVLTVANYQPVVAALNTISHAKERSEAAIGDVYLIACENTVSAQEVMQHPELSEQVEELTRKHVRCVNALVDRVCVDMDECLIDGVPTVRVRAEPYGALKLELCSGTDTLPELLAGSKIKFSRHLNVEKDVKSWMVNGSHWLIALTAFQETGGDVDLMLNEFIDGTESHRLYASEVIEEMRDGVEALLRNDPQYAKFVQDVDVNAYLKEDAATILERFRGNADAISRILARFRAPSPEDTMSVQTFVDRFLNRIDQPLMAYVDMYGFPPKSATKGIFNLFRLQAAGTYVDTGGRSKASMPAA